MFVILYQRCYFKWEGAHTTEHDEISTCHSVYQIAPVVQFQNSVGPVIASESSMKYSVRNHVSKRQISGLQSRE